MLWDLRSGWIVVDVIFIALSAGQCRIFRPFPIKFGTYKYVDVGGARSTKVVILRLKSMC